jgi:regulator of sigma D
METALITLTEWLDYRSKVLAIYDGLVAVHDRYPSPTSDNMLQDCEALLKFVNSYVKHKEETCK